MDKKYLLNVLIYVLSGVVALFLIFFVIFHLTGSGEASYSTVFADKVVTNETVSGIGYVFRYETPLFSKEKGSVYSPLKEGERVMKGQEVARLYEKNEALYTELLACDRSLDILKDSLHESSISAVEAKIKALSEKLRRESSEGTFKDADILLADLVTALGQMKNGTTDSSLSSAVSYMEAKRKKLVSELGSSKNQIYAPMAGGYYSYLDGYERIFSGEKVKGLTMETLEELIQTQPEEPKEGASAGKILYSSYWHLAILTDSHNAVSLEVGKSYPVNFHKNLLEMKLEQKEYDPEKGKSMLVFSSRQIMRGFADHRAGEVSVVSKSYKGLKVPTGAVRYKENEQGEGIVGVYVKNGNRVLYKKIEILMESDGYYVVKETEDPSSLQLFDSIVTKGKDLKEGYVE